MSWSDAEQYARDDMRMKVLLSATLEGGQWKSEAWALADSLSWAIGCIGRFAGDEFKETDRAEYSLAQTRLERVRKEIK